MKESIEVASFKGLLQVGDQVHQQSEELDAQDEARGEGRRKSVWKL